MPIQRRFPSYVWLPDGNMSNLHPISYPSFYTCVQLPNYSSHLSKCLSHTSIVINGELPVAHDFSAPCSRNWAREVDIHPGYGQGIGTCTQGPRSHRNVAFISDLDHDGSTIYRILWKWNEQHVQIPYFAKMVSILHAPPTDTHTHGMKDGLIGWVPMLFPGAVMHWAVLLYNSSLFFSSHCC